MKSSTRTETVSNPVYLWVLALMLCLTLGGSVLLTLYQLPEFFPVLLFPVFIAQYCIWKYLLPTKKES